MRLYLHSLKAKSLQVFHHDVFMDKINQYSYINQCTDECVYIKLVSSSQKFRPKSIHMEFLEQIWSHLIINPMTSCYELRSC